jgi:hypothetical protein
VDFFKKGSFLLTKQIGGSFMENLFRLAFEKLINGIIFLAMTGSLVAYTINMQEKAAQKKRTGLISMRLVNEQLVGKTPRY